MISITYSPRSGISFSLSAAFISATGNTGRHRDKTDAAHKARPKA